MMIFTIAARELRSLFLSPLAWVILAVIEAILAYFFLLYLDYYMQIQPQLTQLEGAPGITDMVVAPLLATAATVLLLVTPLLTMRLISEEQRNQSLALLMSAPISISEIVLGKFCGILAFQLLTLALILLMPLSLLMGGSLDAGMFLSAIIGLLLLLASFSAIGLFMSTLTYQPVIAAISSFGVLVLLWIIDFASTTGEKTELFAYVSLLSHYQAMLKGIFNSSDFVYYVLVVVLFISLSIHRLDSKRVYG